MCDCTSGNLKIPGSTLTHCPGMTETISRFTMTRLVASLLLALAGLVLFGQGAYIHAKALLAQVLLERAFSETIATGREVKPWSWADTWPVARIEVKRLHASAIVLAGSSGQALAFGPGHVELTPDAGERRGSGLFRAPRYAFPLSERCRHRR
jgi:sortase A